MSKMCWQLRCGSATITTLIFLFHFLTDCVKEKKTEETQGTDREKGKKLQSLCELPCYPVQSFMAIKSQRKSKPQLWNISYVPNASIV